MTGTVLMVAVAAILWGANFNLSQPVLAELPPLAAGAGRFAIAAAVMLALAASQRQPVPLRRHFRAYLLLGTVGIGGFNLLFFAAMTSTSAVNGALIMATNPLVTALLAAAVLGERIPPRRLMALPVALGGVVAVVLGRHGAAVAMAPGDGLMVAANLCWAGYNILGKRLMPAGSGLANTAGVMTMGAMVLMTAALVGGGPVAIPGPRASLALAAMAVGGSVVAYLFWNAGLARLGAQRTSLFLNLVPVSTMTIAAALGSPPSPLQWAGAAVVLAAVTAAMLPERTPLPAPTPTPDRP